MGLGYRYGEYQANIKKLRALLPKEYERKSIFVGIVQTTGEQTVGLSDILYWGAVEYWFQTDFLFIPGRGGYDDSRLMIENETVLREIASGDGVVVMVEDEYGYRVELSDEAKATLTVMYLAVGITLEFP